MTEEIVDTDRTKIEQSTNQHFSVLVIFSVKWTVLLNKEVKSRKIERDCVLQYYSTARTVITKYILWSMLITHNFFWENEKKESL